MREKDRQIGEKQQRAAKFRRHVENWCHWIHFRWQIYDRK